MHTSCSLQSKDLDDNNQKEHPYSDSVRSVRGYFISTGAASGDVHNRAGGHGVSASASAGTGTGRSGNR